MRDLAPLTIVFGRCTRDAELGAPQTAPVTGFWQTILARLRQCGLVKAGQLCCLPFATSEEEQSRVNSGDAHPTNPAVADPRSRPISAKRIPNP